MNRRNIVVGFEIIADKSVCIFDSIHKIASALNHSLVNEFSERLFLTHNACVKQKLIPEAAINKVTCGMFGTTYVQVYITPVIICLTTYKLVVVFRIHITEIVG